MIDSLSLSRKDSVHRGYIQAVREVAGAFDGREKRWPFSEQKMSFGELFPVVKTRGLPSERRICRRALCPQHRAL